MAGDIEVVRQVGTPPYTAPTIAELDLAPVLPRTAATTPDDHLNIGGCETTALANESGTQFYVFDKEELSRQRASSL